MPTGRLILPPGADRSTWLATRQEGIGGSDLAGILGRSPFTTAAQVYLEKLGHARDLAGANPLEDPLFWGNALEDAVASAWSAVAGKPVWNTGTYAHVDRPWQRGNPDRLGVGFGLEVKTAGVSQRRHWDPDLVPGGVPFYYLCQVMHYMAVTGLDEFWLICLLGGNRLLVRHITSDPDDIAALTTVEERFWYQHVLPRRPPLVTVDDAAVMGALYPATPGARLELPEYVVPHLARHRVVKRRLAELEAECAELEVAIKDALREHEIGLHRGRQVVTWKNTKRRAGDGTPVRVLRNTYTEE